MFGYVRPSDGHLTAEDKQRFQAAYCGLCPQPWAGDTAWRLG